MHDLINQKKAQRHMHVPDLVYGRQFQLAEAAAMPDHRGWAHLFCSAACRDAFGAEPDRIADGPPPRRSLGTGDATSPAQWPGPQHLTFKPKEIEQ